jgi:hypothetical protein
MRCWAAAARGAQRRGGGRLVAEELLTRIAKADAPGTRSQAQHLRLMNLLAAALHRSRGSGSGQTSTISNPEERVQRPALSPGFSQNGAEDDLHATQFCRGCLLELPHERA